MTENNTPAPLQTRFLMEIKAMIGAPVIAGPGDKGHRQFIPITGGRFDGEKMSGEVLPGADWQLIRNDGVMEIEAIYAIRTEDGTVIHVNNSGIAVTGEAGSYVRTTPRFMAPTGTHDWMNKTVFLATIDLAETGDHVIVRVFEVL